MKAKRILVPLDGSPLAEMALTKAVELLRDDPGATLILLRAVEGCIQATVAREAESYLAALAERLEEQGLTRVVRSVWYCDAANAIVEAARSRRVNLIVMSTHGRSGLRRILRGSVAQSVLRRTRTPILLVSARGDADVDSRAVTAASESSRQAATANAMSSAVQ